MKTKEGITLGEFEPIYIELNQLKKRIEYLEQPWYVKLFKRRNKRIF